MSTEKFIEKYHPNTIEDMVLSKELKKFFTDMMASNNLADMTFVGPPGIGKTTIVNILVKHFNAEVLFVPCGIQGNIDTVKTNIKSFVEALDIEGRIKIVILDEADQLSGSDTAQMASSAQKALRSLMGDKQNAEVRWLLTANYENKLIAPIKSRCPVVKLNYSLQDLAARVINILNAEKITYEKSDVINLLNNTIKKHYPDIRKIINIVQTMCSSGALSCDMGKNDDTEYEQFMTQLSDKIKENATKPLAIREFVLHNKAAFNDNYAELASNIMTSDRFKAYLTIKRIEKLAEYVYRMNTVIDPEIQFFAFCTALIDTRYN